MVTLEMPHGLVADVPTIDLIGKLAMLKHRLEMIGGDVGELTPEPYCASQADPDPSNPWATASKSIDNAAGDLADLIDQVAGRLDGE